MLILRGPAFVRRIEHGPRCAIRYLHPVVLVALAGGCGGRVNTNLVAPADGGIHVDGPRPGDAGPPTGDGAQSSCPPPAFADSAAATIISRCIGSFAIAVDESNVYWSGDSLMETPLDGGSPIALDRYWASGIAVSRTQVYWTQAITSGGAVQKVAIQGGRSSLVAGAQDAPFDITVDTSNVYWGNSASAQIMKAPLAGGAAVTLASGFPGEPGGRVWGPRGIAVDDTSVYWGNNDGTVAKIAKGGGTTVVLAAGQDILSKALAVDATSVYWTNGSLGTVMRIPKTAERPSCLRRNSRRRAALQPTGPMSIGPTKGARPIPVPS